MSPFETKARLSPLSGTMLATVPSATRSSEFFLEQVGLGAQHMPEAALAQLPVHRDHGHEHKADRSEMVEPRKIVLPVRVDQRIDRRQGLVRQMMVDRHHIEAKRLGFNERLDAGRAAIDRDEELRALPGERAHRFGVRAIAFEQAIGNVDQRLKPAMAQEPREHCRRRRTVHVVVADTQTARRCSIASAMRAAALGMSVSVSGSGMRRRTVGS